MSKAFTRLGKEIAIAVKQGGPEPESNPRLRTAIQNAKGVNMPKDKIESAIKRAASKDTADYQELVYEGYGPHGVAIVMETATDNPTRTVANIRSYLTRAGGSLGTSGSLDFMFERKGMFRFSTEGLDMDELELELIDYGAEDIATDDGEAYVYTQYADVVRMARALEQKGITVLEAEVERIPLTTTEPDADAVQAIDKLIERIEEDDDVQAVYHNMKSDRIED